MGDPISAALQCWERAVQEVQRLEREWLSLAPKAAGREELRRRCDLQAANADDLFDRVLVLLRSQEATRVHALAWGSCHGR